ncbi:MAG: carbon-nitrogen hydrolase [Balneolaceae bacterium]
MKLSLVQNVATPDSGENLSATRNMVREAASNGAEVVLLQELFHTPYFCREIDPSWFDEANRIPGPLVDELSAWAREEGVVLIAPLFEEAAPGLCYNSLVVIEKDGSLLGRYRKMHIPDDPGFYEKYYFRPGDEGYRVFDTSAGKIGTLICWDQWFPEAARLTAMKGADLLVYPTAIGRLSEETLTQEATYHDAWQTIQRSHAIANGCFVAAVNRVGQEGDLHFWGRSFVCGPMGQILAEAGTDPQVLHCELDVASIRKQRQTWPFFRDRRTDSYGGMLHGWGGQL